MKVSKPAAFAALVLGSFVQQTHAVAINVDELLFQKDIANPALLSQLAADIDIDVTGAQLKIVLKNLTGASTSSGALVLLTGMGFNLPSGLSISSGTAAINPGSAAVGWVPSSANNLSKEWGYQNGHPTSGHLDGNGTPGTLLVNTVVSSMQVDTTTQFLAGSISSPGGLGGPDFGIVSTAGNPGGQESVRNAVLLTLTLNSAYSGGDAALESYIDSQNVVVTFASPDSGALTGKVSDTGSNLALLMGGLLAGAGLWGRSRQTA